MRGSVAEIKHYFEYIEEIILNILGLFLLIILIFIEYTIS